MEVRGTGQLCPPSSSTCSSLFSVAWKEVWRKHIHDGSVRHRRVLQFRFYCLHVSLLHVPSAPSSHGSLASFLANILLTGLFNITSNTAHHCVRRTGCLASHSIYSLAAPTVCKARSDALKLCHSMPASQPQKAGDKSFPSLWVRTWRCRKTRQQAQVAQLSECWGQDQTQVFLTPKPVLSAGSHRSTGSQCWNLRKAGKNTHAAPLHFPLRDGDSICGD